MSEVAAGMKILPFLSAILIIPSSGFGQSLNCRFETEDNYAGLERLTGTVVRTATAAILEYDGGFPTETFICSESVYQCHGGEIGAKKHLDFSFRGFMIYVTTYSKLDMTLVGLARIECR